jgi:hypothetical protein
MQETKRMTEEGKRMGQEAQEQAKRVGQAVDSSSFEAASRSFSEMNSGFQAIAAEMTDFSRRRFEDVVHAWNQLLRARSFGDMVEVQSRYAQKAYDAYMSEMSKIGEMYLGTARNATKPVEEISRRLT